MTHDHYMRLALAEAEPALEEDEVPVGAVIVQGERVIAAAHNQREQLSDPTAHAEMIAITQAARHLDDWRLEGCTLYVTLEPCIMCSGAILQARIPIVVYGATDPKAGAVQTLFHLLERQPAEPPLPGRPRHPGPALRRVADAVLSGAAAAGKEIVASFRRAAQTRGGARAACSLARRSSSRIRCSFVPESGKRARIASSKTPARIRWSNSALCI